jgi:hypothetical protein
LASFESSVYATTTAPLRPYIADPAYWEENFGPYLQWLRQPGDTTGIYGIQSQVTVTGPFINRTLFEQAEVAVPSDENEQVTWEEWAEVSKQVAELDEGRAAARPAAGRVDQPGLAEDRRQAVDAAVDVADRHDPRQHTAAGLDAEGRVRDRHPGGHGDCQCRRPAAPRVAARRRHWSPAGTSMAL